MGPGEGPARATGTSAGERRSDRSRVQSPAAGRSRRRPRSESVQERILTTAREELAARGFRQLTIEGVARRAGAGKTTIYRWWSNKAALLFDALNVTPDRYPEFSDTAETRRDLEDEIAGVIRYFSTPSGAAFLDLVAESRFDVALAHALSKEFVAARREATRRVIDRSTRRGEAPSGPDVETVMDMVWGAIYYRFMVLHESPDAGYARRLLDQIWPPPSADASTSSPG